jgi:hypothetical protein
LKGKEIEIEWSDFELFNPAEVTSTRRGRRETIYIFQIDKRVRNNVFHNTYLTMKRLKGN